MKKILLFITCMFIIQGTHANWNISLSNKTENTRQIEEWTLVVSNDLVEIYEQNIIEDNRETDFIIEYKVFKLSLIHI